jgi:hypothetical protein
LLPGWMCPTCQHFNGEGKQARIFCRVCDLPYLPKLGIPDESELRKELARLYKQNRELNDALSRTQDRCSQLLEAYRRIKGSHE